MLKFSGSSFRACLTSPRARLGGIFSALTALKILAIRQDCCGFLPCRTKNLSRQSAHAEILNRLLEVLCRRRHDTYDNLAFEFNVSRRTIRRDIAILMCSYPIETSRGYGGGVRVADGYYLHRRTLNKKQVALLIRLRVQLDGDDLNTLNSILRLFAP